MEQDYAGNFGKSGRLFAEKDPRITAVCTSNIYAEADRAAAYILQLVREHGYRFGDIVVVCNDTGLRSGVIAGLSCAGGSRCSSIRSEK